jgi:hypothetical protein
VQIVYKIPDDIFPYLEHVPISSINEMITLLIKKTLAERNAKSFRTKDVNMQVLDTLKIIAADMPRLTNNVSMQTLPAIDISSDPLPLIPIEAIDDGDEETLEFDFLRDVMK